MKIKWRKILSYLFLIIFLVVSYFGYKIYDRLYPSPRIEDSPTTFIGFNHIGITVKNLDEMLTFYQKATGYKLLKRTNITQNKAANILFGQDSISFETAILKGPNMLLELTEFDNQTDTIIQKMLPQGPGMTHTCYQSPAYDSGFEKFKTAGISMVTTGGKPVDLGGYGMTYAYVHDPEGNMIELEQMSDRLIQLQIGITWAKEHRMWMTQVALMSPDLPRLTDFYQKVLEIEPYRVGSYKDNSKLDTVAGLENVSVESAWFGIDGQGKKMELMQYLNPATPLISTKNKLTDLGYNFSFEVLDIQKEYNRLKDLGVELVSEPQLLDELWMVFAYDVDGNIFSLRQVDKKESIYSLKNF